MKKYLNNQKGQAIFELIIFIPFLVFLYSIYYTVGNSISGSINQQKAVRGYFYALVKGNSYINSLTELEDYKRKLIGKVGFSSLGWREKSSGGSDNAFANCFAFSSMLRNDTPEACDDKVREIPGESTRFIRVFTYYGVCGPVYEVSSDDKFFEIDPTQQNNHYNCSIDAKN